jgi:uroporphyrinogen decarboxylase
MIIRDQEGLQKFNREIECLNRELSTRLADHGVMGLILADDMAHSNGLFAGPDVMLHHFLPSLSRQAEQILSLGLPLFFHSDGDFMRILPQISAIGFHGLHCIDPDSNMDLAEVRSRVGKECCLWGTLTARDLERCAVAEEREHVVLGVRDAVSAGRFILGTTSGLFKGLRIDVLQSIYNQI